MEASARWMLAIKWLAGLGAEWVPEKGQDFSQITSLPTSRLLYLSASRGSVSTAIRTRNSWLGAHALCLLNQVVGFVVFVLSYIPRNISMYIMAAFLTNGSRLWSISTWRLSRRHLPTPLCVHMTFAWLTSSCWLNRTSLLLAVNWDTVGLQMYCWPQLCSGRWDAASWKCL